MCDHGTCDHVTCDHVTCDHVTCDHGTCDHASRLAGGILFLLKSQPWSFAAPERQIKHHARTHTHYCLSLSHAHIMMCWLSHVVCGAGAGFALGSGTLVSTSPNSSMPSNHHAALKVLEQETCPCQRCCLDGLEGSLIRVCFFVLCSRHRFNRGPGGHLRIACVYPAPEL